MSNVTDQAHYPKSIGETEPGMEFTAAENASNSDLCSENGDYCPVEPRYPLFVTFKPFAEWLLALILLIPALPIILLSAMLVKATSRGPAFYLQTRLSKDRRRYRLIKLRTMVHDAELLTGPVWAGVDDTRITPIGQLLRASHIDEFPQLFNVLMGHMCLTGPRPERPELAEDLEFHIPQYSERLKVQPGITGLAQLKLPADSDLDSVRRKLMYDLYYIQHCSFVLDAKIFVATAWLLAKTICQIAWGWLALPQENQVAVSIRPVVGAESDFVAAHQGTSK